MRLNIENDGREVDLGAESPLSSPDDLRLFSIRERLQYLGGSLEVELGPGPRTLTSIMVPLMEKPTQKSESEVGKPG